jgi:Zn finger protein HypA/HybF involved in hydrogenase expression
MTEQQEVYTTCRHCSDELEYDAVNPFCDPCWLKAIHKGDVDTTLSITKWIARVGE